MSLFLSSKFQRGGGKCHLHQNSSQLHRSLKWNLKDKNGENRKWQYQGNFCLWIQKEYKMKSEDKTHYSFERCSKRAKQHENTCYIYNWSSELICNSFNHHPFLTTWSRDVGFWKSDPLWSCDIAKSHITEYLCECLALPGQLRKIIAVTAAIARNQRPVKRSICKVVSKRPAWMCKDDC